MTNEENDKTINALKPTIVQLREAFYLDADGICRWVFEQVEDAKHVVTGCDVCGTSIRYLYWLNHPTKGKRKVGCECIGYLKQAELLKVKAARSKIEQIKRVERLQRKAVLLDKLIRDNIKVLGMAQWQYYSKRPFAHSLFELVRLWEQGTSSPQFESYIEKELQKYGLSLPNLRLGKGI